MKQIPFRYPEEVEKVFQEIKEILRWSCRSKNETLLLAIKYLITSLKKLKKQHKDWDCYKFAEAIKHPADDINKISKMISK